MTKVCALSNYTCVRLLFSLMLLTIPAAAGTLFDNFPINGGIDAWTISEGSSVSDSFVLGSGATVTGVNFGLWLPNGTLGTGAAASIEWSIGTAHSGSSLGSGTAAVSVAYIGPDGLGLGDGIFDASFSISGPKPTLVAGTQYYLTLQGYSDSHDNLGSWDENDGSHSLHAWSSAVGNITYAAALGCGSTGVGTGTCSESFQILGDVTAPEPSTWALFGMGISAILAAFALRRKAIRG